MHTPAPMLNSKSDQENFPSDGDGNKISRMSTPKPVMHLGSAIEVSNSTITTIKLIPLSIRHVFILFVFYTKQILVIYSFSDSFFIKIYNMMMWKWPKILGTFK